MNTYHIYTLNLDVVLDTDSCGVCQKPITDNKFITCDIYRREGRPIRVKSHIDKECAYKLCKSDGDKKTVDKEISKEFGEQF